MNAFAFMVGWLIALTALLVGTDRLFAGARSKLAQEAAEHVAQRFGRQLGREGAETLGRKIEAYAARHGEDFIQAIKRVGPRSFHLVDEAGVHGAKAVQAMARHGEHGAAWIVGRPKGMQLFLKHGDDAGAMLVKHKGVAEPLIERMGQPAVKALQATNTHSGRRLAMMLESGDLAKIGRGEELLEVIAKFGDRAVQFVWDHKVELAASATLAAFLVNPEPFINGARDITQIVGENAVRPVMQIPAAAATEVARNTNWTILFIVAGLVVVAWFALSWFFRTDGGWMTASSKQSTRPSLLTRLLAAISRRLKKR